VETDGTDGTCGYELDIETGDDGSEGTEGTDGTDGTDGTLMFIENPF
jgi:hypothetical protein